MKRLLSLIILMLSFTVTRAQISGCTDMSACNYDSQATTDDGSCSYPSVYYFMDADFDGFGSNDMWSMPTPFCTDPGLGWSLNNLDCNDFDDLINPAASELCNGLDDNCSGSADDGLTFLEYFADADGDSFGTPAVNYVATPITYQLLTPQIVSSNVTLDLAGRIMSYTGISLNGATNTEVVAAGSTVTLTYNLAVTWGPNLYCPGCFTQSYIGIGGSTTTLQCENGIYDGYTTSYNSGTFTAPIIPGTYYIVQNGSLDYFCQPQTYTNTPANAIAILQVEGALPSIINQGPNCDDCTAQIPIGFSFPFYGNTYSNLAISSNGFVSFDLGVTNGCCSGNIVPGADAVNNMIALGWFDLIPTNGEVTYFNLGSPNRLVIQYTNASEYSGVGSLTGQIVLFESGLVQLIYSNLSTQFHLATAGLENSAGTVGVTIPGLNSELGSLTNVAYEFVAMSSILNPGISSCSPLVGYALNNTDCLDTNPAVNPSATEVCNGIDDNCNTLIDDVNIAFQPSYFPQDSWNLYGFNSQDLSSNYKGFYNSTGTGVNTITQWGQSASPSEAAGWSGCPVTNDDHSYSIKRQGFPSYAGGSTILLTNWDDEVQILVNGTSVYSAGCCGNSTFVSAWSGVLDATSTIEVRIIEYGGESFVAFDVVPTVPGCIVTNACNYDPLATTNDGSCIMPSLPYYADNDGDGYGTNDPWTSATLFCTAQSAPWSLTNDDCNDGNPTINPGAPEVCNGIDDNCNGTAEEGLTFLEYFVDTDIDGYGVPASTYVISPITYSTISTTDTLSVIPSCDNCTTQIPVGFSFPFYGNNYTDVAVSSEGFLSFNLATGNGCCSGGIVPSADAINNSIYVGWHDLQADTITYFNLTNPSRLVIDLSTSEPGVFDWWTGIVSPGGILNAQVVLFENGNIEMHYNNLQALVNPVTVGVENINGLAGVTLAGFNSQFSSMSNIAYQFAYSTSPTVPGISSCSALAGYAPNNTDCIDTNPAINPGAAEICNEIDENCNGQIDEGVQNTYYVDNDGDGFGSINSWNIQACSAPLGFVTSNSDCNDTNPAIYPGAAEVCNGIDDNCDGQINEGFGPLTVYYADADGDGYGNGTQTINVLLQGSSSASLSNGSLIIVGSNSNSLSSLTGSVSFVAPVDATYSFDWNYSTVDGAYYDPAYYINGTSYSLSDIFGSQTQSGTQSVTVTAGSTFGFSVVTTDDIAGSATLTISNFNGFTLPTFIQACSQPAGYAVVIGDCNDAVATTYPGAAEICNEIDENCNGQIDEGVQNTYYVDNDGDGFGSINSWNIQACSAPLGFVTSNSDCNDTNPAIYPGAAEVCNGIDDNCDGQINEGFGPLTVYYADADGDGYGNGTQTINVLLQGSSSASLSNGSLIIVGSNSNSLSSLTGSVSFVAPVDATYSFDWNYSTVDGAYYDPAYYINGTSYSLSDIFGSQTQSGTQSVTVTAGSTFGFSVVTTDDIAGSATLTISNFNGFTLPTFIQACSQPAGYAVVIGDCNDAVATTYPGATELCTTSVDDNCNGLINEGCVIPGEDPSNAISLTPSIWPACSAVSGTLVGAAVSTSAQTICLTGEDRWHQFVATSEGVSIVVNSTFADIVIELQTAAGVLVAQENAVSGLGGEILNHYGLTAGQVYKIGVRNYNSAQGTGTYSICAKMLKRGGCDYGPGPYTLCQYFKATWAGATGTSYTYTFTGISGPASGNVYTRTQNSDICVLSTVLPTLPYGSTYNVLITNTYTINNGAGVAENISVPALSPCTMNTATQPVTVLRTTDRCAAGPRFRGAVVAALPWVCGATNWRWEFTELNAAGQPVGLPITINRGAASNYITLSTVAQLQYGKTYNVRTAPILSYTGTNYQWGTTACMSIVGSAGMIAEYGNESESASKVEIANEVNMSLYPNPTHGTDVNINLSGVTSDNVQIRVVDAMGRQVWSNRYSVNGILNTNITFEQPLANGLYFVEAIYNGELQTQRMMVQR